MQSQIVIRNARLHNLKNVTVSIPKNKLIVFTGLSGSGKSSLAFDTLHKEGQRQYMESLGLVTDGLTKPPVDAIEGLSPSISVDQHLSNHSPRSTVGTATEVYTYLRVLFARLGHQPCPACGQEVPPVAGFAGEEWEDEAATEASYPCPHCGHAVGELGMAHFSFNKPAGACPTCTGLGSVHDARLEALVDVQRSILDGAVHGWDVHYITHYTKCLQAAGKHYGFAFDVAQAVKDYGPAQRDLLLYGVASPQFQRHYPHIETPTSAFQGRFEGIVTNLLRRYAERANDADYREKMEKLMISQTCPDCNGTRLRAESRAVRVAGRSIVEVAQLPLAALAEWVEELPAGVPAAQHAIAAPVIDDLRGRIRRLVDVGVGYLTLERSSPTLSAGEAQRLRLAALLGSGLTGVLYILDEPTIGLHPRDNRRLIGVLQQLRDLGNTVLVIEHDLDFLQAADYVVDFGPGAGRDGGRVVAAGTPAQVAAEPGSLTGRYLAGALTFPQPPRRPANGKALVIRGARQHNLKDVTARIPLGVLVAITGASGSGKSSLLFDIFDKAARQRFNGAAELPGEHDSIEGWHFIDRVITMDQSAIGRSTRSNAATYTDAFTPMREAFAATPEAKRRGLTARHFSFNTPGGRCERCEGAGALTISMHFLPDVPVRCPACHGRRFKKEVLAVKYNGADIAEALDLTIAEALPLFKNVPAAASRLQVMVDVGLGYLQLGQPATTLSGGEAQRVKLAKELGRKSKGHTLYLLDEPTTGLHVADTARLLALLQRLVDAGNSVIAIEHNLELIRSADWIIDLGPEGGASGGAIVAEGSPEQVARVSTSHTGKYL
ncbi:MAG: excinuclease ABC subunit UvrA [Chloroflexota bacterium]